MSARRVSVTTCRICRTCSTETVLSKLLPVSAQEAAARVESGRFTQDECFLSSLQPFKCSFMLPMQPIFQGFMRSNHPPSASALLLSPEWEVKSSLLVHKDKKKRHLWEEAFIEPSLGILPPFSRSHVRLRLHFRT